MKGFTVIYVDLQGSQNITAMNTDIILSQISQFVALEDTEAKYLESLLIPRTFKQGELIVESGGPARYLIFVNDGYLMTYYTDKNDFDHVVQFARTGWWTGDLHSLSNDIPTIYSTKGLTDGEVLLLPKLAHDHLLEKYINFERYFRIIFQNSLMRLQFRMIESYSTTAEERYLAFREKHPKMEQYVSQKYIASFLGITPEFLSKIRRKLLQK